MHKVSHSPKYLLSQYYALQREIHTERNDICKDCVNGKCPWRESYYLLTPTLPPLASVQKEWQQSGLLVATGDLGVKTAQSQCLLCTGAGTQPNFSHSRNVDYESRQTERPLLALFSPHQKP